MAQEYHMVCTYVRTMVRTNKMVRTIWYHGTRTRVRTNITLSQKVRTILVRTRVRTYHTIFWYGT